MKKILPVAAIFLLITASFAFSYLSMESGELPEAEGCPYVCVITGETAREIGGPKVATCSISNGCDYCCEYCEKLGADTIVGPAECWCTIGGQYKPDAPCPN